MIPPVDVRDVDKVWLTRKEAAKYLGVSVDFIKTLCLGGRIPWYKVCASNGRNGKDGVSFIKKDDLDEFISRSEHRTTGL